ncbi:hypothetical protein RYH73_15460 [Olivibacter sp. CPCC 100613]|uniref:hypothetical protein n=1 Tax=Olivibacter sp. CPCC 100613 TaxID=3079931 RepID=UPI002FFA2C21
MQTANFLGDIAAERGLLLLTGRIMIFSPNIALRVGKMALEDTEATSSKAFARLFIWQYASGLRK